MNDPKPTDAAAPDETEVPPDKLIDRSETGFITLNIAWPMQPPRLPIDPKTIRIRAEMWAGDLLEMPGDGGEWGASMRLIVKLANPAIPLAFVERLDIRDFSALHHVIWGMVGNSAGGS